MRLEIDGKKIEVCALNTSELNSNLIRQWNDLEMRSIEENAYLSPKFILPSIKYLTPDVNILFIFIAHLIKGAQILTGVGVFEFSYGAKHLPFPHLRAYRSPHSYLSGLLIDEEFSDSTIEAFFTFVIKCKQYCGGVEFIKRTGNTKLANKIQNVAFKMKLPWYRYNISQRAILVINKLQCAYIDEMLSKKIKKNIRYSRNVLAKLGEIRWNIIKGQEIDNNCVDRFLNLEHKGWKNATGTSLLSSAAHEAFFREMINGFADSNRAFFTELLLNGRAIASTSNLISSKSGFAFKIGWDPEYAVASPGILNEIEFIENAARLFPHLVYLDSGADEGAFIEKLWLDSYMIESGLFVTKPFGNAAISCLNVVRRIKHLFYK